MYYTDCTDKGEPPIPQMTPLRSQETVATLGSMNGDFLELMRSSSLNLCIPKSAPDKYEFDDLSLQFSSHEAASLAKAGLGLDGDWLSESDDDDSSFSGSGFDHAPTKRYATISKAHKAKSTVRKACVSRKRKNYEKLTEGNRVYVNYTDRDVLCQRGGLANRHPGNHRYLAAKDAMQPIYLATPKSGRTAVAQDLVNQVYAWGGRFLRKDGKKGWYEIHNHTARTKAGQALREDYTPEERKDKRERNKRPPSAVQQVAV